jgi:EAL and modified HD-GYP domain-containing signal transduction protein
MDAILELSMQQVLDAMPIDAESKTVLLGGSGRLRPFYQLMLAQESGEWQAVSELSHQLHLKETDVSNCYWEALQWARLVTAGASSS